MPTKALLVKFNEDVNIRYETGINNPNGVNKGQLCCVLKSIILTDFLAPNIVSCFLSVQSSYSTFYAYILCV